MKMSYIENSQRAYFELIKEYEQVVFSEEVNQKNIAMMLDNIQCFWLEKKEILKIELENITSKKECFILSGAIYLDVDDYEHYIFKSLGDVHIISDPLLKLENFFRVPISRFNRESIEIFRRAFHDVLKILSEHLNLFYILPIKIIAISDEKEHLELLEEFLLKFINSILSEDFKTFDNFFEKYSTYDEIEENMSSFFKTSLTFCDSNDNGLPLKEKIEGYISATPIMISIINNKSEAEKFILVIQNWITQIIDILVISLNTNITPYIRFKPTFHYLTIVMYTFLEDKYFRNMIEKTIVFYILSKTVNKDNLVDIEFSKFVNITRETNFLNIFIDDMRKNKIDIFKTGVEKVGSIIEDKFCSVLKIGE